MKVYDNFMLWSPYVQGNNPKYTLDRRLGGPGVGLGWFVKKKICATFRRRNPVAQPGFTKSNAFGYQVIMLTNKTTSLHEK